MLTTSNNKNLQEEPNHHTTYQHSINHYHQQYRCYLRTSDMKSKIQLIRSDQSVIQLKQSVIRLFQFKDITQPNVEIKLIVNEDELTNQMNLSNHLFQNAIIHVILDNNKKQSINSIQIQGKYQTISIKIKQPPINCPIYTIENININSQQMTILKLKQKVLEFYKSLSSNYTSTSEQNISNISDLQINDLYLVYCGQILNNSTMIKQYNVNQNGIIYVVNGKKYAKQVTKEQAQRRIQQVRNQHNLSNVKNSENKISQEQQIQGNSKKLDQNQQNLVFNIIQSIVHDEDSDVQQGSPVSNDIYRSQKIIHRYDSLNKDITNNINQNNLQTDFQNNQDKIVERNEQGSQNVEGLKNGLEKNSVFQFLSNLGKKIVSAQQKIAQQQQPQQYQMRQNFLQIAQRDPDSCIIAQQQNIPVEGGNNTQRDYLNSQFSNGQVQIEQDQLLQ